MPAPMPPQPALFAHRGYSARFPEMTVAAYQEAIRWSGETGVALGLECDVHFSADDQLICLHDLDVDRTSDETGPAFGRTVAELRRVDFGARRSLRLQHQARMMVTLVDLLDLVADARSQGIDVTATIETKHPNPRGLEVEERVARLLTERGWDRTGAPCRVISFSAAGIARIGALLPEVERTWLVQKDPAPVAGGRLPVGVEAVGLELALLRRCPELAERIIGAGRELHVWTVNAAADVRFCLDLGVTGLTTDDPEVVRAAVAADVDAQLRTR